MGADHIFRHGNGTSCHRHTCTFALQAIGIGQRRDNPLHGLFVSAVAVTPVVVAIFRPHPRPSLVDCGHAVDAWRGLGWCGFHHSHSSLAARHTVFPRTFSFRLGHSRNRSRRVLPRHSCAHNAFGSFGHARHIPSVGLYLRARFLGDGGRQSAIALSQQHQPIVEPHFLFCCGYFHPLVAMASHIVAQSLQRGHSPFEATTTP